MGSINTFGVPTTLKSVKKLIDKKEDWQSEITQYKTGIISFLGNAETEYHVLDFKPDIVLIFTQCDTDGNVTFRYASFILSNTKIISTDYLNSYQYYGALGYTLTNSNVDLGLQNDIPMFVDGFKIRGLESGNTKATRMRYIALKFAKNLV